MGRRGYKCTTTPALRAGWRQIAAATVGCTTFRVIPFTPILAGTPLASPRGRAKVAFSITPERTEPLPKKSATSPIYHSDRSASGVEESTTWDDEPPQDKTCYLGRFLDSHSFARNDMSGGGTIQPHRLYSGRSLRFRWWVYFSTNGFQKRARPSPITVN